MGEDTERPLARKVTKNKNKNYFNSELLRLKKLELVQNRKKNKNNKMQSFDRGFKL